MGHKRKHYDKTHPAGQKSPRPKRRDRNADRYDENDDGDFVYDEYSYERDFDDSDEDRSELERRFQSRTHGPASRAGRGWNESYSTDDEEWDDFGYDYRNDFNDAG
ncbi:MAG: hypothetical protein KDB61_01905 [Planctomycetes bacterium]|nr:hypothetical protein [Planctomycetota bacterium]